MSHHSFQLLEINLISAQDLALVSKSMKTYAMVWINQDQKLTTRIDQTGHFNPTWNEKFVFRVNDAFLDAETSSIMIDIYAVAWLRDVLIGSVRAVLKNILFESDGKNNGFNTRFVALQVRRPSGRPQGIITMGVSLVNSCMRSMPMSTELTSYSVGFHDDANYKTRTSNLQTQVVQLRRVQSDLTDQTTDNNNNMKLQRKGGSICYGQNGSICNTSIMSISELTTTRTLKGKGGNSIINNGSVCYSDVGPSASIVAAAIAKGLYKTPQTTRGKENKTLKNWTEREGFKTQLAQWRTDMLPPNPIIYDSDAQRMSSKSITRRKHRQKARSSDDGDGLFSCFGNVFGCEISVTCGGGGNHNNRSKGRNENGKVCHLSSIDDNNSRSLT